VDTRVKTMRRFTEGGLFLLLLAGCRTEPWPQVNCDAHLIRINTSDAVSAIPVAREDRRPGEARGHEH
jgi:hypothetical protein